MLKLRKKMNLIESAEESQWGFLKRSHQIQSFMKDGKVRFKKMYTFQDNLTKNFEPKYFKLVLYDEDIQSIKFKKNKYYMFSDCVVEDKHLVFTRNSFMFTFE